MNITSYLEKRFSKDPSIVSRKIADEFILVPIKQKAGDVESIYTINEVGSRIWELIDSNRSLSDIKEVIVQEFEVSPEEAEADIVEFIEKLDKIGAVKEI